MFFNNDSRTKRNEDNQTVPAGGFPERSTHYTNTRRSFVNFLRHYRTADCRSHTTYYLYKRLKLRRAHVTVKRNPQYRMHSSPLPGIGSNVPGLRLPSCRGSSGGPQPLRKRCSGPYETRSGKYSVTLNAALQHDTTSALR